MAVIRVAISHTPLVGKGRALREALEEHTRASNEAGGQYALHQHLTGNSPAFVNYLRFDGFAGLDAYRATGPADAARQARISKITECLAQPQTSRIFESIAGVGRTAPPAYVLHHELRPALGKLAELRAALEDQVKTMPAGAVGMNLSAEVPGETPNFQVEILFPSLAGFEEFRAANRANPAFAASQAKVISLLSTQPISHLCSVLVTYPPR